VLLVLVVAGCGGGDENKVSGRVLYDGKPVRGGLVTFVPTNPKARSVTAELDGEGNYAVFLPVGEVKIGVDNRELEPRAPAAHEMPPDLPAIKDLPGNVKPDRSRPKTSGGAGAGRYVKIPRQYYDAQTSEIKYTVTQGNQTHDIDLPKVAGGR
jgi:hypothetical protein